MLKELLQAILKKLLQAILILLLPQAKQLIASEIFTYILKRLLQAILTLFLASALCFAVIQLAPGNYFVTILGYSKTARSIKHTLLK